MRPVPQLAFSIAADVSELAPAATRLRAFLEQNRVSADAIFAFETVLEEIATNAIKYGCAALRSGRICLTATAAADRTELVIEDEGKAFDPTKAPEPSVNRPLEDMPIGGLGIHLIRSMTDGFEYQRVNQCNRVTVWLKRRE
jgi:serine/threonine-protein kinase RsbW